MKQLFAAAFLCGWCCLSTAQTTTNILDTFNRNGSLSGSSPNIGDVNSGAATNWSGSSFTTTTANGGAMIAANAKELPPTTEESCNTHNTLKLTARLFEREPRAGYADYFERALYNRREFIEGRYLPRQKRKLLCRSFFENLCL